MKNYVIYLLFFFVSSFAMKHPREEEIIEPAKKQKVEAEKAALEQLPKELKELITSYLLSAPGATKTAQLYNAAQNIRNLLMTSKAFARLLNDVDFNGYIINEFARRYTDNNIIKAALALATSGASAWLRANLFQQPVRGEFDIALITAIKNNEEGQLQFLVQSVPENIRVVYFSQIGPEDDSLLHYAAQFNKPNLVKKLVRIGISPNSQNRFALTPLLVASKNGYDQVIKQLLETGADVNKSSPEYVTALYLASEAGHLNVVKLLLHYHADANKARTNGVTPLMLASYYGFVEIVKLLLNAEADVHKERLDGKTALHAAQESASPNKEEIIKLLHEHGAVE